MLKNIVIFIFLLSAQNLFSQQCEGWLKINNKLDAVTVGDIDITGNVLTIEAICNPQGTYPRALVSKHSYQIDVNYFLCADLAQITTTKGFFSTSGCKFKNNNTYHVAMVYNGKTLKLYRNGYLLSSVAASGNLITNDYPTTIGEYAYSLVYNRAEIANSFPGYINEVRIWNIERSQNDLRKYMTNSLPNPTTTKGLIGYYVFDNLLNKQGNTRFNGQLHGKAQIKKNNPNCILNTDSCEVNVKKENICTGEKGVVASFSVQQSTCFQYSFEKLAIDNDNNEVFFWQFGDGKTSAKKSPVHIYAKPGNYTATLIVKNKYGCADTMEKKVRITLPNNSFTYKTNDALITLTANNKKLINNWSFGDNTAKEEGATITHAFKQPGDYTVTLTSTDQLGCVSTKSQIISIANTPITNNIEIVLPTIENKALADANLQLVQKINQRAKNVIQTISVANDSIAVYFYDNAEIDGDSITISFNNSVIEKNLLLSAKGKKYLLHLDKTLPINELVMYAENQGSIPPNTALMLIYDGEKRYELHITSTDTTNGTVVFTFNKK